MITLSKILASKFSCNLQHEQNQNIPTGKCKTWLNCATKPVSMPENKKAGLGFTQIPL
jgi:hypothetical protein